MGVVGVGSVRDCKEEKVFKAKKLQYQKNCKKKKKKSYRKVRVKQRRYWANREGVEKKKTKK